MSLTRSALTLTGVSGTRYNREAIDPFETVRQE
jgi:hypothetical protein